MKLSIILKENRSVVCLHPENDYENQVIKVLEKLPNAHKAELFDTQGGFVRSTKGGEDLQIVFENQLEVPKPPNPL